MRDKLPSTRLKLTSLELTNNAEQQRVIGDTKVLGSHWDVQERYEVAEEDEKVGKSDQQKALVLSQQREVGHFFQNVQSHAEESSLVKRLLGQSVQAENTPRECVQSLFGCGLQFLWLFPLIN